MSENNNKNNTEELDMNHLMQIRRDKLKELQEQGKDPYQITKFDRTNTAGEIKANYEKFEQKDVTVVGRIIAKRIMGKASFCTIQDCDEKIQSYVSRIELGEESLKLGILEILLELLDLYLKQEQKKSLYMLKA